MKTHAGALSAYKHSCETEGKRFEMQSSDKSVEKYIKETADREGGYPVEDESRTKLRLRRKAGVQITSGDDRSVTGTLRDISLDSLYVQIEGLGSGFYDREEPVEAIISLDREGSGLTIEVDGKILRIDKDGIAIKFDYHLKWWPVFTLLPETKLEL